MTMVAGRRWMLTIAAAVIGLGVPAGPGRAATAPKTTADPSHPARLFRVLILTQGRLLVSVRRPARVTVFANGHRLERRKLKRGRVYELPVHRSGRIRIVAVAGALRQTVVLYAAENNVTAAAAMKVEAHRRSVLIHARLSTSRPSFS